MSEAQSGSSRSRATVPSERVSTEHISSGELLIEDVEVDDGEVVARSGTLLDTRLIADLRDRGIQQVRIKAKISGKRKRASTDLGAKARRTVERCVREALVEIAPRFRHNSLSNLQVKTLFHACALRLARKVLKDRKR